MPINQQKLSDTLDNYGYDLIQREKYKIFKALLRDIFPREDLPEISILVLSVQCGVAEGIQRGLFDIAQKADDGGVSLRTLKSQSIRKLSDGYSIENKRAEWVVKLWMRILENPPQHEIPNPPPLKHLLQLEPAIVPLSISPASGTYSDEIKITLSCRNKNVVIRYTDDGSEPSSSSRRYTKALLYRESVTIKAKGYGETCVSDLVEGQFTILHQLPKVIISPFPGKFSGEVRVEMSCDNAKADIRYTDDGSEPTDSSKMYTGILHYNKSVCIKAKAFLGKSESPTTSVADYSIQAKVHTLPKTQPSGIGIFATNSSAKNETSTNKTARTTGMVSPTGIMSPTGTIKPTGMGKPTGTVGSTGRTSQSLPLCFQMNASDKNASDRNASGKNALGNPVKTSAPSQEGKSKEGLKFPSQVFSKPAQESDSQTEKQSSSSTLGKAFQ